MKVEQVLKSRRIWEMIANLDDGTLSPFDRDELFALLGESEEVRKIYFEYFEFASVLKAESLRQREERLLPLSLKSMGSQKRLFGLSAMAAMAAAAAVFLLATLSALLIVKMGYENIFL